MNIDLNAFGGTIRSGLLQAAQYASTNSPTILTSIGAAGVLATTILGIKATFVAVRKIDEATEQLNEANDGPKLQLDSWDKVKIAGPSYIPTVLMAGMTIACIIGANRIHLQRNAALMSLYSLTETSLREYQQKTLDLMGSKKEASIREALAGDAIKDADKCNIIVTGRGQTLFFDTISGRSFLSDLDVVNRKEVDLKLEIINQGSITLNDLYVAFGLEPIEMGVNTGWTAEYTLDIIKTPRIDQDNKVHIVLSYQYQPRWL